MPETLVKSFGLSYFFFWTLFIGVYTMYRYTNVAHKAGMPRQQDAHRRHAALQAGVQHVCVCVCGLEEPTNHTGYKTISS